MPDMHVRGDCAIGIATLPSNIEAAAQTPSQSTGRERAAPVSQQASDRRQRACIC